MINLNNYIIEAWSGVKRQTNNAEIEVWCEEMGIKDYTINSKGVIDVGGNVWLYKLVKKNDFKELPYKFGTVTGYFDIGENKKLVSLKNCPNEVGGHFGCRNCPQLDSLEECPKEVGKGFYCVGCKREFTKEEVKSLCKVKGKIHIVV